MTYMHDGIDTPDFKQPSSVVKLPIEKVPIRQNWQVRLHRKVILFMSILSKVQNRKKHQKIRIDSGCNQFKR